MKVVIFGGSGFLGSFVADQLTASGHDVTIFDINHSPHLLPKQKMVIGDMMDKNKVSDILAGKDAAFNFAGIADIGFAKENPYDSLTINYVGNLNILEACVKHRIKRYLFASTLYVYSALGSIYRVSKQACELTIEAYAERFGLKYSILRYGSLYGPRANNTNWIYSTLCQAFDQKKIIRAGDGGEIREYIHVTDAARLSIKAMQPEFENQCVIISGSQSIKIRDLMVMIKEMFNNDIKLEFVENTNDSHYEITPFNFRPKLAKKIEDVSYIDLGQGLLDLIYTISDGRNETKAHSSGPSRNKMTKAVKTKKTK